MEIADRVDSEINCLPQRLIRARDAESSLRPSFDAVEDQL
jgi:hypothetical protein